MTMCEGSFCFKPAEFRITVETISDDLVCGVSLLCRDCGARVGAVAPSEAFHERRTAERAR